LLAALLALPGCGEHAGDAAPRSGAPLLEAPLAPLAPDRRAALADFRGRRVIVNFWATWCAPCREELPGLQRLSDALAPRGIAVIGVNVDADRNLAREFLLRHGVRFENFSDPGMAYSRTAFGITALPVTFALDSRGAIAGRALGARAWDGAPGGAFVHEAYGLDP